MRTVWYSLHGFSYNSFPAWSQTSVRFRMAPRSHFLAYMVYNNAAHTLRKWRLAQRGTQDREIHVATPRALPLLYNV